MTLRNQLLLGALNSYSTPFSMSSCSSASETPRSPPPVVLYSSPLLNSPLILPEPVLMVAVSIWPSMTWVRHSL
jgi:hypothetical protein